MQAFFDILGKRTFDALEDRYKDRGAAKIRNGEFFLQDLDRKRRFNLQDQPWSLVMRPGQKRHVSVTFRESGAAKEACLHCGVENDTVQGQPTTW